MKIEIKSLQKRIRINISELKKIASSVRPPQKFKSLDLNIYLVNNNTIRKLKHKFFGEDIFTDVIAFNIDDNHAEVFIAPGVVRDNAKDFNVTFKEELNRCIIHGILHIFGYRDEKKIDKKRMWDKQEKILMLRGKKVNDLS